MVSVLLNLFDNLGVLYTLVDTGCEIVRDALVLRLKRIPQKPVKLHKPKLPFGNAILLFARLQAPGILSSSRCIA